MPSPCVATPAGSGVATAKMRQDNHYVSIRRALKVVSRMRNARVGGHGRGPLTTPTKQVVQDSWIGLVTVCVFITAGPITKLFAGGGGGEWTTYRVCVECLIGKQKETSR